MPTIDLRAFDDEAARREMARAFDAALSSSGMVHLTGYEAWLPTGAIDGLRRAAAAFFASDAATKRKAHVDGVWSATWPWATRTSPRAPARRRRTRTPSRASTSAYQEGDAPWHSSAAAAECPWRDAAWLPQTAGFGEAALSYFDGATKLMLALMTLAELALDLPAGYFAPSFEKPGTLLRVAWYPPAAAPEADGGEADASAARLRYGAHTDYDGFTILQRAAGEEYGLEMQTRDGWRSVPSPPDALTVNIGDLLARWTNDRWRATNHRVRRRCRGGGGGRPAVDGLLRRTRRHRRVPAERQGAGGPPSMRRSAAENVEAKMKAATKESGEWAAGADSP